VKLLCIPVLLFSRSCGKGETEEGRKEGRKEATRGNLPYQGMETAEPSSRKTHTKEAKIDVAVS